MQDHVASGALAQELAESSAALTSLAERVAGEHSSAARIDFSGWSGPASWGARLSLLLLEREIEAAADLIRWAASLTSTASWEVQNRG